MNTIHVSTNNYHWLPSSNTPIKQSQCWWKTSVKPQSWWPVKALLVVKTFLAQTHSSHVGSLEVIPSHPSVLSSSLKGCFFLSEVILWWIYLHIYIHWSTATDIRYDPVGDFIVNPSFPRAQQQEGSPKPWSSFYHTSLLGWCFDLSILPEQFNFCASFVAVLLWPQASQWVFQKSYWLDLWDNKLRLSGGRLN